MSKNNNNGSYDKPPYEVGYGKPPKHSRFKPGMSGNKKGRTPKERDNIYDTMEKTLYKELRIRVNGDVITKNYMELIVMKLAEKAMQGNVQAAGLIYRFAEKFNITPPKIEAILPYIPTRTEMRAMDPDFNDDNL